LPKPSKMPTERNAQLEQANRTLNQLQAELRALEKKHKCRSALSDHLSGFYEEIEKLAKGRTLVEATTLVVDKPMTSSLETKDRAPFVSRYPCAGRMNREVPTGCYGK
jgi:hypothetical protein